MSPTKHKRSAKSASKKATVATSASLPFEPVTPARPFVDPKAVPLASDLVPGTVANVQDAYAKPDTKSPSNVTGDPTQNLQTFSLTDLAQYTKENTFSADASKDVHLFYVGRDDVHDILKHMLSRVTISLYLNMFGFDDSELNNILMQKALNPAITMLITLDKSQAGGVHEKALLEADAKYNLAAYGTHFVIGQSETHQISHTKGFVADGKVAAEGSTNWSSAGEGTFVVTGHPGGPGYKAQNNTQSVITDRDTIIRFQTELIAEHMTAQAQQKPPGVQRALPLATTPTAATAAITAKAAKAGKKGTPAKKKAAAKKTTRKNTVARKAFSAAAA
jgi:hypothetical protein